MLRLQLILLPFLAILVASVGSSTASEKTQGDDPDLSLWRNRRKWGDNAISAWGKRAGMMSYDYGESAYPDLEEEAYERKNHFYETLVLGWLVKSIIIIIIAVVVIIIIIVTNNKTFLL